MNLSLNYLHQMLVLHQIAVILLSHQPKRVTDMTMIKCNRCDGTGRLPHFGHVNNGVCLKCRGAGKVVKTKRVVTIETHYHAVTDTGDRVYCDTDKARAEWLVAEWAAMNVEGTIETREVKKIDHVPV
jgi:DnaJ-class molecular chaperone